MKIKLMKNRKDLIIFIGIFLIAAFVFTQYSFQGALFRDDAFHIYMGQQFAKGIPPYVSAADGKTPLSPMLVGLGIKLLGNITHDDVYSARIFFLLLASATVACLYLLGKLLYESRYLGALASFTFMGYWKFGSLASSGPQSKTAMSLFQVLALLLTSKKYWFWAGFSGSLAFLVWQPMIIYPIITVALSFVQSKKGKTRTKNFARAVLGAATPILLTLIYFVWKDALSEFIYWPFTFAFTVLAPSRSGFDFLSARGLLKPINSIITAFGTSTIPIALGAAMIGLTYIWRIGKYKNLTAMVSKDKFSYLLLTLPIPILWTLFDYQGGPDFFVFLPYVALGFAWMISLALYNLESEKRATWNLRTIGFVLMSLMLIGTAARNYQLTRERGLDNQREWVAEINDKYLSGNNQNVVVIGMPEYLVLTRRTNPNPYVSLFSPIPWYIDTIYTGGLEGWLDEQITAVNPAIVIRGQIRPIELEGQFDQWLLERGYILDRIGDWKVFVDIDE